MAHVSTDVSYVLDVFVRVRSELEKTAPFESDTFHAVAAILTIAVVIERQLDYIGESLPNAGRGN